MYKLSIIIPVYNVEKYVKKCLESIINQKNSNCEIIIVNDGSTDNSLNICQEYASYNNVQIISQENGGLSAARNTGLQYVNGEYCMFLDSDDYVVNNTLSKIIIYLNEKNPDILIYGAKSVDEKGMVIETIRIKNENIFLENDQQLFNFLCKKYLNGKIRNEVWNKIYKVDLIKNNNITFTKNKEIFAEDICFNLEYFYYCKKVVCTSDSFYRYLIRNDSIMGNLRGAEVSKNQEFINLSNKIMAFYKKSSYIYDRFVFIWAGIMNFNVLLVGVKKAMNSLKYDSHAKFDEYEKYLSNSRRELLLLYSRYRGMDIWLSSKVYCSKDRNERKKWIFYYKISHKFHQYIDGIKNLRFRLFFKMVQKNLKGDCKEGN